VKIDLYVASCKLPCDCSLSGDPTIVAGLPAVKQVHYGETFNLTIQRIQVPLDDKIVVLGIYRAGRPGEEVGLDEIVSYMVSTLSFECIELKP
jgi:hypothetical protein